MSKNSNEFYSAQLNSELNDCLGRLIAFISVLFGPFRPFNPVLTVLMVNPFNHRLQPKLHNCSPFTV